MPTKRLFPWVVLVCMALMMCLVGTAFAASTGSVKGTVHKNSASGSDLSGVKVTCGGKSDTTGKDGKFEIKKVPTGNQTISFSKSGYESFQTSVTIVKDKKADVGKRWLTATTGSVSGRVHKNSASGSELSGVKVTCGGKSDTTDSSGNFKIDSINPGSQTISFSKSGFESYQTDVKIVVGSKANVGDRWLTEINSHNPSPVNNSKNLLSVEFKAQVLPGAWATTKNCGQTSSLMAMSYLKGTSPTEQGIKNIDDWLHNKYGDAINGYSGSFSNTAKLEHLVKEYGGFKNSYKSQGWDLDKIKDQINQGRPVITAVKTEYLPNRGYNYSGGHFVLVVGYTDTSIICNDPGTNNGKNKQYPNNDFLRAFNGQGGSVVVVVP